MNLINTEINSAPNEVRRFILENQPVRGYWVDLDSAWTELRAHQHYAPAVQTLLGEAVSASVLLAATLKFEGTLTLQLEGKGDVRLLVAQCSHDFRVRGVVRLSDEAAASGEKPVGSESEADARHSQPAEAGRHAATSPADASSAPLGVFDLGPRTDGSDPFAVLPKATDALAAASFRQLVGENGRVIVTIEGGD